MNIDRHNYEEWFMRFADNELNETDQQEVKAFAQANPDLQAELQFFLQCKLDPSEEIVFAHKADLLQSAELTLSNCNEWFVAYADKELTADQEKMVNAFVARHPSLQPELYTISRLKLQADADLVYPDKKELYRYENDRRIVPIRWWTVAAAAMVILVAGLFWLTRENEPAGSNNLAETTGKSPLKIDSNYAGKSKGLMEGAENPVSPATSSGTETTIAVVPNTETIRKQQPRDVQSVQSNDNLQTTAALVTTGKATDGTQQDPNTSTIQPATIAAADRKTELVAAVHMPAPDQPSLQLVPEANNQMVQFASSNNTENVNVLVAEVSTKNSMRGLLRKASRIISKRNNAENNGRGILVGGFEIAVR